MSSAGYAARNRRGAATWRWLAGGKRSNDGRGDQFDTVTTLAWRGTGTSFTPKTTPSPPATVGGG